MALTLQAVYTTLVNKNLLKELIVPTSELVSDEAYQQGRGSKAYWTLNLQQALDVYRATNLTSSLTPNTEVQALTYDTRTTTPTSLLVCKGNFSPSYLEAANANGFLAYVAEDDLSAATDRLGFVVTDARKALAVLAKEFYGNPQEELTVVGITGTKGKTTTAYFTHALLNRFSRGHAALVSSAYNCVNGSDFVEADLTTPESLELFRMMREACDAGVKYLVMEISSQAYKVHRVYDLTFDVGVFLNISPDHLSPIEHPSFEDYLFCKRQVSYHAKHMVINAQCDYASLIAEDARKAGTNITSFALDASLQELPTFAQTSCVLGNSDTNDPTAYTAFYIQAEQSQQLGALKLAIPGFFNGANALAAISAAHAAGMPFDEPEQYFSVLQTVRVPGRMEILTNGTNVYGIVDYAHNYLSITGLLDYVHQAFDEKNPYITVIVGAAGNKAYDRREAIVRAVERRIDRLILTTEDTNTESPADICNEILGYVQDPDLDCQIILDRAEAIRAAGERVRQMPERFHIILALGKGDEAWLKYQGKHVEFEGDHKVMRQLFDELTQ